MSESQKTLTRSSSIAYGCLSGGFNSVLANADVITWGSAVLNMVYFFIAYILSCWICYWLFSKIDKEKPDA